MLPAVVLLLGAPAGSSTGLTADSTLESLAFYYGTDKSHDDHKYTDLYAALFDPIRKRVRNVTEIGLAQGQSMQVWRDYFSEAHIYGVDIHPGVIKHARQLFAGEPRVHILRANSRDESAVAHLGLSPGTMDVIIDDGDHYPPAMQKTLLQWWPYLAPGGYYCIEDIATGANAKGQRYGGKGPFFPPGYASLVHNFSFARPEGVAEMRRIFDENDAFFVDTLVGHRAYESVRKALGLWMKDQVNHDSHILVIRRRAEPRTHEVHSALAKKLAMWETGVRPNLRRRRAARANRRPSDAASASRAR